MRTSSDVLVVGAGPVGLLLACELQRQGVDYLLAERSPQRSYFCKALDWNLVAPEICGLRPP